MTKFAGLALLALIAASPSSALDWNGADPVAQFRPELAALSAVTRPVVFHADVGTPGQFDSYVFSLEWTAANFKFILKLFVICFEY